MVSQDLQLWPFEQYYTNFIWIVVTLTDSKIKTTNIVDIDLEDWSLSRWYEGQYVGEAILSRTKGGEGEIKTDSEERAKLAQRF